MRNPLTGRARTPGQQGYALLLVMFFLALLVLTTITVAPNVLTDGRREKEKEMVWRGNQYVRGIKRYYMKTHRFPTEIDDLVKPKTGIRFLRQAYKDPMNDVDGSWRLIYVGPNGQLIGSLKNRGPGAPGMSASGFGASPGSSSFGSSSFGGSSSGQSSFGGSSFGGGSTGGSAFGGSSFGGGNTSNSTMGSTGFGNSAPNPTGQPDANANGENPAGTDLMSTPQSIAPAETPVIIGGNIIGVGSKVNKKSFMVYDKAKNYREFEFIWDPSKDMAGGVGGSMQTGPGLGTPAGAPNTTSPFSSGFGQNQNQNPAPTPPMGPPEGGPPLQAPPPNQN
jgi:hypothetical protein